MRYRFRYSHVYSIIFIIGCYILLPVMNYEYLFALQENSLWVKGHTFMEEIVNERGGWLSYIACYLTQILYYPWLGTTILILLWLIIFYLITYKSGIPDKFTFLMLIPIAYLPVMVLSLGYWLYYSKCPGFAFLPTLKVLVVALIIRVIYILFIKVENTTVRLIRSLSLSLVFFIAIISVGNTYSKFDQFFITVNNDNFRKELRMYHALDECRWRDILDIAPKVNDKEGCHPTNFMVLCKNIALMNTGQLAEQIFMYDNCCVLPQTDDSLKVHLTKQSGPMLYYHFGFINYAYRWSIENGVKYYYSFDSLKMLVRCAIFNQEFEVAMKYITILKSTTFQRKWALEHEAMIYDNRLFINSKEYQCISPLMTKDNELAVDDANIEYFILDYFSNLNSSKEKIEELALNASLQLQQEEEFMIHFYNYTLNHQGEAVPQTYQQAAYMLGPTDLSPIDVSQYPFDISVTSAFDSFINDYRTLSGQGKSEEQIATALKTNYGTTYWWYYYFYHKHNYY